MTFNHSISKKPVVEYYYVPQERKSSSARIVFIRHGESEGNVANDAAEAGHEELSAESYAVAIPP
jgi:hypothetical protein